MRPGEEAIAATAYAKSIAPMVDAQLIGRLTEKILLVYKETGTAIAIHQAAEQAAKEHNRIVLAITDPVERLIQVGEVAERLRQELRATAGNPAANKR